MLHSRFNILVKGNVHFRMLGIFAHWLLGPFRTSQIFYFYGLGWIFYVCIFFPDLENVVLLIVQF